MTTRFNITIDKGSYFEAISEVKYANNDPVDLTGMTFYTGIKSAYDYSDVLVEFDIDNDGNTGIFTYSLASNSTLDLRAGDYIYDIYLNDGTEYYKIIEGNARVIDKATDYVS